MSVVFLFPDFIVYIIIIILISDIMGNRNRCLWKRLRDVTLRIRALSNVYEAIITSNLMLVILEGVLESVIR